MSSDEEWRPTISEITSLLDDLGLSPPENSFLESLESSSSQKCPSDSDFDESFSSISEDFNREEALGKLLKLRKSEEEIRGRNFQLSECLIDFFERKQMLYVISEENEGIDVENYEKSLKILEKCKEKLENFKENSKKELKGMESEIEEKKMKVGKMVEEMLENGRKIQENMEGKKIQVAKQLEKLSKISEFRLSYIKLRNELFNLDGKVSAIIRKNSNLTKTDYERLEAEKFFYLQQLEAQDQQIQTLGSKKKLLKFKIETSKWKIGKLCSQASELEIITGKLNLQILELELKKKKLREKILSRKIVKKKMREEIWVQEYGKLKEFHEKVTREHEKWIKKIARQLKQLKILREKMSAVKTFFYLHEKNI